MTQITITLPEAAQAYIDEPLANGTHGTLDEMMTALIPAEKKRQEQQPFSGIDSCLC